MVLGAVVVVLLVTVLVLAFALRSSSDGVDAADGTTTTTIGSKAPTTPTTSATSTTPPAPTAPPTAPPPTTSPTTLASPSTEASAPPTVPVATADELTDALDGYVSSLSAGDIDVAYGYVAPSLRGRDGWDYETFAAFRRDRITGATLVSVETTSASTGTVTATVDYYLPDGGTSRELVRAVFAPAGDSGALVMTDYEVLDTDVLG